MSKFLDWIADNGWTFLAGAAGVILGVMICTLRLPPELRLPDPITNLVGAVAGSVATIGGAILLWKMQERKTAIHALAAIRNYASTVSAMSNAIGAALQSLDPGRIAKAITGSQDAMKLEQVRLERIYSQLNSLSRSESERFYDLEDSVEEFKAFCEVILEAVNGGNTTNELLKRWTAAMDRDRQEFEKFARWKATV